MLGPVRPPDEMMKPEVSLVARPVGAEVPPPGDTADAAAALRTALRVAAANRGDAMRRAELQRALAILDSTDDGSEVSDVAWPFFVLPARG